MIEKMKTLNKSLRLSSVKDDHFRKFGNVLPDFPVGAMAQLMKGTDIPEVGNVYIPSVNEWEKTNLKQLVESRYFGGMSVQLGYCNGKNSHLNGLEFHKSSEINIAITDFVLLLGHVNDIKEGRYSVGNVQAFFVPKGTAIELFQTTLHLAPCKVSDDGFKCAVILPKGTNTPLKDEDKGYDEWLFMKNKWLLSHPDNERFMSRGAHAGIVGANVAFVYK
ncbi:DUF4867 family protein [Alkalihalophilus sp. As8PL]|uniref:DUF4867 family protein n=1 Tax=Alkalihalophilus sp. As8PL TaxID=3237103 RepID=A0AB39BPB8_9BACI